MNTVITEHPKELTLISDGWSNPRGESIINYLLATRNETIFLKSVATGKDRHTGEYIADGLVEVISEIGSENIIAVTTDNAGNMKSSWQGVQEQYPEILCLGCSSHMTNLLVEDIMKLPVLQDHFEIVKEINRYWKNSSVLIGLLQFTAKQSNQQIAAPQLPGNTRWQGKLDTLDSNISNKIYMQ
jgi:Protein of unknown function (DUF 659)